METCGTDIAYISKIATPIKFATRPITIRVYTVCYVCCAYIYARFDDPRCELDFPEYDKNNHVDYGPTVCVDLNVCTDAY